MSIIDDLSAGVTQTTEVEASAAQLLDNLADLLQEALANATPVAAVQSIIDQLKSSRDALTAAIVANTPTPPPAP